MTTRERTAAEIETGARAIYQNRSQTRWAWEELEPKVQGHFLAVAREALSAADAVAAPAVGVTVAWLDERIAAERKHIDAFAYGDRRALKEREHHLGKAAAFRMVRDLLTAPEPGTDGGAG